MAEKDRGGTFRWFTALPVGVRAAIIGALSVVLAAVLAPFAERVAGNPMARAGPDTVLLKVADSVDAGAFAIQSVLVGAKRNQFRLEVSVWNPSAMDAMATHLQIASSARADVLCYPVLYRFVVADRLRLQYEGRGRAEVSTSAKPVSGGLAGYSLPVNGELTTGCGQEDLILGFDVSVPLAARARTDIYADIPRRFRVSESQIILGDSLRPLQDSFIPLDLMARSFAEQYWKTSHELRIELVTNRDTLRFVKQTEEHKPPGWRPPGMVEVR